MVKSFEPRCRRPRCRRRGHGWIEREPRTVIGLLGGSVPDDEMMLMASRLHSPGPWQALVHGDPCPDNVLLAADGTAKLIDFEFARPGHALLDAAYWRMGFPTCWCAGRVPDALSRQLDDAYRIALAEAVPAAADVWLEDLRGRWAGCSPLALYPAFTIPVAGDDAASA
jgi:hypothetical protein